MTAFAVQVAAIGAAQVGLAVVHVVITVLYWLVLVTGCACLAFTALCVTAAVLDVRRQRTGSTVLTTPGEDLDDEIDEWIRKYHGEPQTPGTEPG